ncbi:MAG: DEAD/DEAH box helicase [Emcibacter sp.]|nr:DEAD/DEAH box helicase [Emcibacter sp.]
MGFDYLGLSEDLLSIVEKSGYTVPTPIQAKAIPATLQGRDILGIAQTGTGKTASFTLPMIDILSQGRARARMPRSLILEPTRELATQVSESFEKYGAKSKLTMALLIGGVAFADQEKKLDRGVDVLIATPGRLMDHMQRGKVMLNGVEILVVDEADRMLDMGFIPDVEKICQAMPQKIQSLFFSATMPREIKRLTDKFLKDPKEIEVSAPASTAQTITQRLCMVKGGEKEKRDALRQLLKSEKIKNAIIFCNRKSVVKILAKSLAVHGYSVGELHGDMVQSIRTETLAKFKNDEIQLLVASDVAARGLDIPDVSHVFNFEIPNNPEDYVHRIGRTGRAGREGSSFTLTSPAEKKNLGFLHKFLGKEIQLHELPGHAPIKATERPAQAHKKSAPRKEASKKNPAKNSAEKAPNPQEKENTQKENAGKTRHTKDQPKDKPNRHQKSEPVIGMGDHTPAFLLSYESLNDKKD